MSNQDKSKGKQFVTIITENIQNINKEMEIMRLKLNVLIILTIILSAFLFVMVIYVIITFNIINNVMESLIKKLGDVVFQK